MKLKNVFFFFWLFPTFFQQTIVYINPLQTNQPSYFPSIYEANNAIGSNEGEIIIQTPEIFIQEKIEIVNKIEIISDGSKVNVNHLKEGQIFIKENAILILKKLKWILNGEKYDSKNVFNLLKNSQIHFQVIKLSKSNKFIEKKTNNA
jgi:hypothetical protein